MNQEQRVQLINLYNQIIDIEKVFTGIQKNTKQTGAMIEAGDVPIRLGKKFLAIGLNDKESWLILAHICYECYKQDRKIKSINEITLGERPECVIKSWDIFQDAVKNNGHLFE